MGFPAIGNNGFGVSSDKGLKRVPREGPPTRMMAVVEPADADLEMEKLLS